MKKTTRHYLASIVLILSACATLHGQTYFVQSLGGTDGPPYPFDPTYGTASISEIGPDQYLLDDEDFQSLKRGNLMTMDSLDPGDPGNTNGYSGSYSSLPDIRNYDTASSYFCCWTQTPLPPPTPIY